MSTIQAILKQEFQSWVDVEAVTVTLYNATAGAMQGIPMPIATASQLNEYQSRNIFGDLSHDTNTKVWTIPDALLNPNSNGYALKDGDLITDANGQGWKIGDRVAQVKMYTQWICAAKKTL